jgi:hypothetical protein
MRERLRHLALAAGAVLLGAGCGSAEEPARPPAQIDERAGTFRGVGIGDSFAAISGALGPPRDQARGSGDVTPLGYGPAAALGLPNVAPPTGLGPRDRVQIARYRGVTFLIAPRVGAYSVALALPGATTANGVAIGDALATTKEKYPGLRCGTVDRSAEYGPLRYCSGEVAKGRYIWFGQDPIRSITLTIRPMA